MDERPMPDMLKALKIIREADPNFKVSLAGSLHKELSDELNDYCIAIAEKFSEEMKTKRKAEGKITTYYTCCAESHPNTYTFSNPAEGAWIAWYAAKENLDGYLRWALNSWTIEPLLDSRFYTWSRRYLPSLSRRKDLSAFRESGGRHTGIRENPNPKNGTANPKQDCYTTQTGEST